MRKTNSKLNFMKNHRVSLFSCGQLKISKRSISLTQLGECSKSKVTPLACIKWWYLQVCVFFFDIFIFRAVIGVKGQKMAQDDKKFCLLHFIFQEPCIKWLSFMVHYCKMMISSGVIFIGVVRGRGNAKGQKMVQNEKKICLSPSLSQKSYTMWFSFMILHLWYSCVKWQYLQDIFFHFFFKVFSRLLLG